jgi:subtilisin family serine protease
MGGRGIAHPSAVELVRLPAIMRLTAGCPEVLVSVIDGPVAVSHPSFAPERFVVIREDFTPLTVGTDAATVHGTFVAGILAAARGKEAPAICPACPVLLVPIYPSGSPAQASPGELAAALVDSARAGARVCNLSLDVGRPTVREQHCLIDALDESAAAGMIIVASAGNNGVVASSVITRHPSVIPVIGYDRRARPMSDSDLSASIGKHGYGAPAEAITSLHPGGGVITLSGTSCACAFVTGAVALLWSLFPDFGASRIRAATARIGTQLVPPLFDTVATYNKLIGMR